MDSLVLRLSRFDQVAAMTPKIDYSLLGKALQHYKMLGFTYVEVPWAVEGRHIDATLPPGARRTQLVERNPLTVIDLVGSAEQGFLSMNLAPGLYVGVTPCFRCEDRQDLLYQRWFMKIELFDNRDEPAFRPLLVKAKGLMQSFSPAPVVEVETEIGIDLEIGGIEVGSYGCRSIHGYRPWAYGTGLALPRFSVASSIASYDMS